jgi:CheY-like chemotaxis protein
LFTVFDLRAKENKTPLYLKRGLSKEASNIFSDRSKLNKIISNLIDNALKFTSDGYIEFGYFKHEGNLRIYVEDTGVGIAIQRQENIFERFSKANNELSNNASGLGLGLSIAKENTKLLRGEISVKSKTGKGTTFFVDIPYKPLKTSKSKELIKSSEIKKESTQSILIADDEEVNYLYLEILIKEIFQVNCEIIHAKNGKEAIKQCEINSKINIVFMDLKMPLIDGYEAMRAIKKIRPNLTIIAQTAYSSEEDIRKIMTTEFDDYIIKPINNEALDKVLKKYNLVTITN